MRSRSKVLNLVDDNDLAWKPSTGTNWMTVGQLLKHLTEACGACFRGFVTGDWRLPGGLDISELPPEQHQPPAEELPTVASVFEAKRLLSEDRKLALKMLADCDEERLNRQASAPWDSAEMVLGQRLRQMMEHLKEHKGQLFYYLKFQGKPVSSGDLWGM